jgi:type I restriction enzyme M protein
MLPEAADIGAKVNSAMREIEKHNPQLAGVLPKTYNRGAVQRTSEAEQ